MSERAAMRITRARIVERLCDRVGLGRADAAACLETVLTLVHRTLVAGEDVRLVGFGHFSVRQRAGRTGVHPATGKPVRIPSRQVVVFKPSRTLKDLIDHRSDSESHPDSSPDA